MKIKQIILSVIFSFSIAFALNINDLRAIQGVNPTPYELNSYILKKCKETNIPPIVVKAILLKEGAANNKWKQYSSDSNYNHDTIVYHPDSVGSYGLGLFQITYFLNSGNESEIRKVVSDWKFNVDKAFEKLLTKWKANVGSMTGMDANPLIIENWYYPIAWYNGTGSAAKKYVDTVYSFMKDRNEVIRFLGDSDTIISYYDIVSDISAPYIINGFRGDNIVGSNPQVYTLQQILNNGGELHIWDKASNSYNNYEENGNSGESLSPNMNNKGYKKLLNPFSLEQCTAFVWGRAYEKKGIKTKFSVTSRRHAKNWLKYVIGLKQGNIIRANSIVVWGGDFHKKADGTYKNAYGHVAFIEKIENNYVYFNEANFKTFTTGGGYDGYVKKMTLDKFKKYRSYAGDILGYIYLGSEEISSTDAGIFDGAGSLVSPTEKMAGGNYDYAIMHPHSPYNSTVVFQWLYDIDSCSQIDLFSYPNNLDVTIKSKAWNKHKIQKAFNVTLNNYDPSDFSKGVTLKRADTNTPWTTLAITSKQPIGGATHIIARCKDNSESFKYGNRVDITPILVDVTHNYYWTGTGSIISTLENRNFENAGVGRDVAVTYKSNNSLTSFQWLSSNNCSKLKIKSYDGSTATIKEIKIKKWDTKDWKSTNCGTSLPCTVSAPVVGNYYILKIKSTANAIKSGGLIAECVQ